ncbi:hypothetical protein GGR56DRAFT_452968 [Xylariaceae sp. FL0804]|nr:hypothetical protein GGR56DRAFT_452968 [Xylariaceae sp. FL0804]
MPRGRRATSRQGGPTRKSARQAESSSIHQEQLPRRGIRRPRSVSRPSPEAIATDLSGSEVEFSSAPVVALERVSESNDAGELDQLEDSPEQRAARAQDIFDFDLPKFSKWCEKVYDVLGSMDSSVPSADAVKRLAVDKRMYDAARRPFVEEAALCIDPDSLPDELSPEQTSKARITIFAGNLVSLALSVFRLRHGHEESLPTLQQLDDSFPVLFDPHFEEYSEDMKEESFGLAFQIRCRRLAETLSADPSKDCLVQAAVIFCEESVAGSKEALRVLTQGPYKQLAGISVDENIVSQEAYQNPLNGLIKRISGHSSEARASLDEAFPEEELYQALWDWMKKTWGHLNSMAMPKGSQEVLRPSVSAVRPEEEPALFESQPLDAAGGSVSGSGSGSDSGTDNGGYEQLQNTDPGRIFSDGRYALAAAKESEHKATLVPAIRGINPRPRPQFPNGLQEGRNARTSTIGATTRRNSKYRSS